MPRGTSVRAQGKARPPERLFVVAGLRGDGSVAVDVDRARAEVGATAAQLFAGYGVSGSVVRVSVLGTDVVEVEVRIDDPAGAVTGIAAARAEAGR